MTYLRFLPVALVALVLATPAAYAAELRLRHEQGTRSISVVLDTQGETINAVEGTIELPEGVTMVLLGDSVVPLWVERPSVSSLRFSGVIPGGFLGNNGTLFSIVPAGTGKLTVTPRDVRAYRNDGTGSTVAITAVPLIAQLPAASGAMPGMNDTDIPDFAEVRVTRDPALFEGRWFVIFNAQDAGTGVARFEIAERRGDATDKTEELTWRPATSPAVLLDQSRRSTVFVRAIDGVGNARIASVEPSATQSTNPYAVLGGGALILLLLAAAYVFRRARLKP